MDFYWLTLGVLAVWRTSHFLNAEDGPFDAGVRLRKLAGSGFFGQLLDCFYCLSLWVSAPLSVWLGEGPKHSFFLWLAFSAGAIGLERLLEVPDVPTAAYFEGGSSDELLREK